MYILFQVFFHMFYLCVVYPFQIFELISKLLFLKTSMLYVKNNG